MDLVWILFLIFQHALQFAQLSDDPGAILIVAHSILLWLNLDPDWVFMDLGAL